MKDRMSGGASEGDGGSDEGRGMALAAVLAEDEQTGQPGLKLGPVGKVIENEADGANELGIVQEKKGGREGAIGVLSAKLGCGGCDVPIGVKMGPCLGVEFGERNDPLRMMEEMGEHENEVR